MHIPDGFLSNQVAVSLNVVSGATLLYAARQVKVDVSGRAVPIMGMLAAFVFAAQMLNFPVLGGTSGHLVGGSLLAILLGPMAGFLTMTTVVLAQALFLQDGGLVALGANVFNISSITCFSGYAVFRLLKGRMSGGKRLFVAGFLAGWVSLMAGSACCAVEMGLSDAIPLRIGLATMLGYHAVVGIVEGTLTAGVLSFLFKVRPDLMKIDGLSGFGVSGWIGALVFAGIPAAILIMAGSSALPDPLEKLLAASPLRSQPEAVSGQLYSAARFREYFIKAVIFVLLVGLGFLVTRLTQRRRNRS
jgi:cobalt/nickel transport system permease protein